MATNLTISEVSAGIAWTFYQTDGIGGSTTNSNAARYSLSSTITDGSGAVQANKLYFNTTSIAASTDSDLDLAGGLTDAFGNTITFTKIKGIYVTHNTTTASSSITVGGGTNPWITWLKATGDGVKIPNGYHFQLAGADASGMAVTAGTGDILRITNNDGSLAAYYTIVIYGA